MGLQCDTGPLGVEFDGSRWHIIYWPSRQGHFLVQANQICSAVSVATVSDLSSTIADMHGRHALLVCRGQEWDPQRCGSAFAAE